jgi:hypothetical protein
MSSLYARLHEAEFRVGSSGLPSSRVIKDVVEVLTQEQPLSRDELLALYRVKMLKCMHAKFKKCAKLVDNIGEKARSKAVRSIRTLNTEIYHLGHLLLRRDSKESSAAMRAKLRELNSSIHFFQGSVIKF